MYFSHSSGLVVFHWNNWQRLAALWRYQPHGKITYLPEKLDEELAFTGNERRVNDVIQQLRRGESLTVKTSDGEEVKMAIPRGMKYAEKTGLRDDGTFFVSEDHHLWRRHGQKKGQMFYIKCAFGKPQTARMRKEGIAKCEGNIIHWVPVISSSDIRSLK